MENRIDFLNLHTGRKLEFPFDVLVIFSTNFHPRIWLTRHFFAVCATKFILETHSYEEYRGDLP